MTAEKKYPTLIGQNIEGFANRLLYDTHLTYGDVNWAASPGGKAVLDAIETKYKLKDEQLQVSRYKLLLCGYLCVTSIVWGLLGVEN